ncbi:MAG: SDR family NAD(P)-dependent oxidoreductase [Solirubrobacterales bacterium]
MRRGSPERETLTAALATAHAKGAAVDWEAFFDGSGAHPVALPTYAFQRRHYWLGSGAGTEGDLRSVGQGSPRYPLLGATIAPAEGAGRIFTGRLAADRPRWLADHALLGSVVVPGAAFVEMALEAGREVGCATVEELVMEAPLVLPGRGGVQLQVLVEAPDEEGRHAFGIHSRPEGCADGDPWARHAAGVLAEPEAPELPGLDLEAWPPPGSERMDPADFYRHMAGLGWDYGRSFTGIRAIWRRGDDLFAELELPDEEQAEAAEFVVHPALLDLGVQLIVAGASWSAADTLRMPFGFDGVRVDVSGARRLRARIGTEEGAGSLLAVDDEGRPVISIRSLSLRPVSQDRLAEARRAVAPDAAALFVVGWTPAPEALATPEGREGSRRRTVTVEIHPGRDTEDDVSTAPAEALAAVQGWLADGGAEVGRLVVVTHGAAAVTEDDGPADLGSAAAWALLRAAQAEYPGRVRLIDLDGAEASEAALQAALAGDEPQLAIRAGVAYVPRLARADAPGTDPVAVDLGEGTVLLTGGTGDLGALLARHLVAAHGVRRLLLASRSGPDAPGAAQLRAELEAMGAEVTVAACDVGDREAVAALLDSIPAVDPLRAVVHAAGVVDDGTVAALDEGRLLRVLGPKAEAAVHLHELTAGLDLAAFVLFSSATATLGSAGQGNYAASNAVLDALAARRRREGLPATAIAWGRWSQEAGMAAGLAAADRGRIERTGIGSVGRSEGLELFDAALARPEPHLVAMSIDPGSLRRASRDGGLSPLMAGLLADERAGSPDASPAPSPPAPVLAGLPAEDRGDAVLGEVLTAVAGVLGYGAGERVAPQRTFNDLGLDSLTGLELRNRLATISGLRLPSTLVFDHPTPAAIARHIAAEIGGSSETPGHGAAGAPTPAAPTRPAASDEPIAVLGMSCRFPGGVADAEDLWRLAAAEVDAMSPFPDDRGWDLERLFDDPGRPGTSHAREGGFLDEMADFDADFFGISPREALAMDPQQRLLLETSWEAIEQAGIDPALLHGSRTGVFVGVTPFEFGAGLWSASEGREHLAGYWLTGTIGSVCSGRISYTYGLEGPSSSVDTACSSALVAIHQAAQALRAGECPLALAAGVTVLDSPGLFVQFSSQRGLARDGRCKSFAEAADGVGWGEGGGVIVLERLVDAERNGHPVLAVLRGSAVNQDGASNGLSAPNGPSQQRVIEQALANSGLGAADVDAVEAHGTGTRLGDPIEAGALLATYGRERGARGPLLIGSVKSNIGHTGAAAGIAGVIKMVKALEHGQLPATLHVDRPSTKVDWEAGEVDLLTEKRPWPAGGQVRRAGVSAFGVSGTNAHLILEEAPVAASAGSGPEPPGAGVMPWVLSAKSEDALREQAGRLGRYLADAGEEPRPEVIARTLSARPSHEHRAVLLGADGGRRDAPIAALAADGADRRLLRGVAAASRPAGLAFLFTGQGAQRPGMGRGLHEAFPVFADAFDAVVTRLEEHLDRSLGPVVFGEDGAPPGVLDRTAFTQAGLFALEVAMFRLLESWGVRPDFLLGHSIGELAAAHVAGVFSLEDGCRLVAARGRLMQALPAGGAMLAVEATEAEARAAMGSLADPASRVALAAVNGPRATVVSGDEDAVAELEALWRDEGRRLRRLNVSHAFHSPRMDPMLDELRAVATGLEYAVPRIPIVSDLTGRPTAEELCDPDYWVRQAREPVRFGDGVEWLLEAGVSAFLELGPDGVLSATAMARVAEEPVARSPIAVPIVRGGEDEVEASFRAVAELWAGGVAVDWRVVCGPATGRLPELPTYPFRRRRYWLEATSTPGDLRAAGLEETGHPLLGATIESPEGGLMMMSGAISLGSRRWLADHVVGGRAILPGSVFLELALSAGERCGAPCVEELTMEAPLPLPERGVVALRVSVAAPDEAGRRAIGIHSRSAAEDGEDGDWVRHAEGALVVDVPDARLEPMTEWPPAGAEALDLDDFYDSLADAGFLYGPAFQGVRRAWRSPDGDVCAEVSLAQDQAQEAGDYRIHPALLDAALHPSLLGPDGEPRPRLPFSWHGIAVGREERPASLRVSLGLCAEDEIDLRLGDGRGRPLVAGRLATRPPDLRRLEGRAETRSLLRVDWIGQPLATGVVERPTVVELETAGSPDPAAAAQESAAAALALVQRSIAEGASGPPLFILTRGAVAASEDELPDLAAASAWGLIGSAQSEHPGRFVLIDHDGSGASAAVLPALGKLLEAGETRLALREGRALAPRLARIEAVGQAAPLDPARTVLLTGATGGLGPVFARHLVEAHGARHLLLLSRSGPEAPGAAGLVEDLRALGAEVEVVACDVGDREDLEGVLGGIDAGRPPGAVFHAAGVLDDGVVASLTPAQIGRVLAPKARGAWNLHELTTDLDLTHFVLFSSAAATLGTPGQANYAAANAFVEALALRRRSEQLPGTAIAWGLWARESGMSAHMGVADIARMKRSGFEPIAEERGIELFEASLSVAEPGVLAVPLRRSRLRSLAAGGLLPPLLRGLVRPSAWRRPAAGSLASTLAEQPAEQRPATVLRLVGEEVATVLGHDSPAAIEPRRAFKEMGFDSLAAVELRNRLAAATGLTLAPTLVFDHPDPTALAEHLRAEAEGEEEEQQPARAPVAGRALEEPVAIVGMSCRYPGGVDSPEDLWRLLAGRGDAIGPFPGDRGWDLSRLFDPDPEKPGTTYAEEGGFLEHASDFDADFFGISPREALAMDPQQRLLLEASWEALEDAGIDPASLRGSDSGVWAGVMHHDYTVGRGSAEQTDGFAHGVAGSVATGRVAYSLGLTGPAVTLDTACSSSLVALHQAAAALRSGECGLALAGGVTVLSTPTVFTDFARQRGLAPDGRSKSFAAAADGVGWSEGVGVVVLELLADARRNGHTVLATIRGSAVNQDGASNGLTAPSGRAQRSVIETALAGAGLTTADVDAVEAHGTGTTLGDPIEAGALLATYGADRGGRGPLRLGSIKSNIGHTQAAAGVAGVIKLVEALRHEELPATIHLDRPSPEVDWEAGEVELLGESAPWPRRPGSPRRAAVSSFGISGTNAHLIIEEAPEPGPLPEEAPPAPLVGPLVLPLSTRGEGALREMAADLAGHLRTHPEVDAADVSFSLATGRAVLPNRAVVGGGGREDLLAGLDALARGEEAAGLTTGISRGNSGPVFLLTGQGAQRAMMGAGLRAVSPVFAAAFDEICSAFDPMLARPLAEVIEEGGEALDDTTFTQPAMFAVEVALARLLGDLGIRPAAMVGHSVGELAAAHLAGVLSLVDACTLVAARGRLMGALPAGGAMVAIEAGEGEVVEALEGHDDVGIAAVNGPGAVVVSGPESAVMAVKAGFDEVGNRTRRLAVSHAFHSSLIDPVLEELEGVSRGLELSPPRIPIISTLTGRVLSMEEATDPSYWARQARGTVRFADAVAGAAELGHRLYVELGPDPVLCAAAAGCLDPTARLIPTLRDGREEAEALIDALAGAHCAGAEVDWAALAPGARRVPLPTYPFQRRRYWLEPWAGGGPAAIGQSAVEHPFLGAAVELPGEGWLLTGRISLDAHPWLADHAVLGTPILPATALLDLALRAGEEAGLAVLRELTLQAPVVVPEHGSVALQARVGPPGEDGSRPVALSSRPDGEEGWTTNATGTLETGVSPPRTSEAAWPAEGAEPVDLDGVYALLGAVGFEYGPAFRRAVAAWRRDDEVFVEVAVDERLAGRTFAVHPALLDSAFHPALGLADLGRGEVAAPWLPFSIRSVHRRAGGARMLRVTIREGESVGEISLEASGEQGEPVLRIDSLLTRPVDPAALKAPGLARSIYSLDWQAPAPGLAAPSTVSGAVLLDLTRGGSEPSAAHSSVVALLPELQAFLASEAQADSRLVVLTRGALAVRGGEVPDPAMAAALGLLGSAASEHPGRFAHIDLDEMSADVPPTALALTGAEPRLALRGGRLLVPRLRRAEAPRERLAPADPDRTVIITGAPGALGSLVARHLVEGGARHVVLASRRGPDAEGAGELRDELVALGAEVEIQAADVCDSEAVEALVAGIGDGHPLGAVIHCAGILEDATLAGLDPDRIERVLAPKVDGAWNLHRATAGLDLERFVLFSSVAGVLGSPGQGAYAAANSYLDALAQVRRADGQPATSIAWGLWDEESGMTPEGLDGEGRLRKIEQIRVRLGLALLAPADGLALLDACLSRPDPVIFPAPLDRAALASLAALGTEPSVLRGLAGRGTPGAADIGPDASSGVAPASTRGDLAARLAEVPEKGREAVAVALVTEHVAAVLGHASAEFVDPDRAFKDLGFDSLAAVELRNRLSAASGLRLPVGLVFDHPSVSEAARALVSLCGRGGGAEDGVDEGLPGVEAIAEMDDEELVRLAYASRRQT